MLDFLRRRRLPKELRDALREAQRKARRAGARTPVRLPDALARIRRVPLVVWFLLLAIFVVGTSWVAMEHEAALPWPSSMPPERLSGRARVIDGDTIAFGSERLRLHGIDAPEISQLCERDGHDYRCGEEARDALIRILGRGFIACDAAGRDRYGRRLAFCHGEDGQDVGAAMVSAGWAVAYTRYSYRYLPAQLSARFHRRGLWAGAFETPSDYRRRNR